MEKFLCFNTFSLLAKASIKQFPDSFIPCWPSSALEQNLDGDRQRRKTSVPPYKEPSLYLASDNPMEPAPLVKGTELVRAHYTTAQN